MKKQIPKDYKPSESEVWRYIDKWNGLDNYVCHERALNDLFFNLCPQNKTIESIILKISVLNNFYSTNIFDVYGVAKHYMNFDIDERLQREDETLVDDLARVTLKDDKKWHFYSFATKYCSHHKPLAYPIYDRYVSEVLKFFRSRDGFCQFKNAELMQYHSFKSIIDQFKRFYGLDQFSYKQIDQYIWQLGKDYYKRSYKKS